MSMTGPALDRMQKRLVKWYLSERTRLVKLLEEEYPYGSVPLTGAQQREKFASMTQSDWGILADKLRQRHMGEPNEDKLVEDDLRRYVERMRV